MEIRRLDSEAMLSPVTDLPRAPMRAMARMLAAAALACTALFSVVAQAASDLASVVNTVGATPPAITPGQALTQLAGGDWLVVGVPTLTGGAPVASGALSIVDHASGKMRRLPYGLGVARSGETATVLPDGRVLVLGGVNATGAPGIPPELLDIDTGTVTPLPDPGLIPRSQHTATLLADGRILITGGLDAADHALFDAELLDTQAFTTEHFNVRANTARFAHLAQWLPSNAVVLSGGIGSQGQPVINGEILDVQSLRFVPVNVADVERLLASLAGLQPALMVASVPAQGSGNVPIDTSIVLRLSKWMDPSTLNSTTIKLTVGGTEIPAKVVAAERGMLVFISAQDGLPANSQVTVSINGARDAGGQPLFATTFNFGTSAVAASVAGARSSLDARAAAGAASAGGAAKTTIRDGGSKLPPTTAEVANVLGRLPTFFEPNTGTYQKDIKFVTYGAGYQLQFKGAEVSIRLRQLSASGKAMARDPGLRNRLRDERMQRLKRAPGTVEPTVEEQEFDPVDIGLSLVGANPNPKVSGHELLTSKTHYFYGGEPGQVRANVPHYAKVLHEAVYPGIDQLYYGVEGKLEYDWIVKPGADPGRIVQRFSGAGSLSINADGDLVIPVGEGSITQHRPIAYQMVGNVKVPVQAAFALAGNTVRIQLAAYDKARPLVIDPIVDFGTYLTNISNVWDMAIASDGSIFILGQGVSGSTVAPTGFSTGGNNYNMYVLKLHPGGQQIDYIAAFQHADPYAIAVDNTGAAPQLAMVGDYSRNGTGEFLGKLSSTGASMVFYHEYSYLFNAPFQIRLDATGNIYTLGRGTLTYVSPQLPHQYFLPSGAAYGCIVSKYSNDGTTMIFQTIIGGQCNQPYLAIDSAGHSYVLSTPSWPGTVVKLAADGSSILSNSTLYAQKDPINGDVTFGPYGAEVDSADNLYVAIWGDRTPGLRGVVKYDPSGNIVYWNPLAGLFDPDINGNGEKHIAVTPAGEVYAGFGYYDASSHLQSYVVHLDTSGAVQGAPFYLQGNGATYLSSLAYVNNNLYLVGNTSSTSLPVQNAVQPAFVSNSRGKDGFLFSLVNHPVLSSAPNPSGLGQPVTLTYKSPDTAASGTVQFLDGTTSLGQATMAAGVATFSTSTLTGGQHVLKGQIGTDSATTSQNVLSAAGVVSLTGATAVFEQQNASVHVQVATNGPVATGTVNLQDGSTLVGTGTLNAQGAIDFSVQLIAVGPHNLTASYLGDSSYTAGTSPTLVVTAAEMPLIVTINGPVSGSAYVIPNVIPLNVSAVATSGSTILNGVNVSVNGVPFTQSVISPINASWVPTQPGTYTINAYAMSFRGVRYDAVPATLTISATGSEVTYFHEDLTGSTIAASDESGQVAYVENYLPYGERTEVQGSPDPTKLAQLSGNRIWFHGKAQDEATGVSYFGARYHDPAVGRFMGIDPVNFDPNNLQSFNRYAYGNNNPYRYRDPNGKAAVLALCLTGPWTCAAVGAGIGISLWIAYEKSKDEAHGHTSHSLFGDGPLMSGAENKPTGASSGSGGAAASGAAPPPDDGGKEKPKNSRVQERWHQGSFDSSEESLSQHFGKHGEEVGARSEEQYFRKADEFSKNLRGAQRSEVPGETQGVTRFAKNGKYLDVAPDGRMISFGAQ